MRKTPHPFSRLISKRIRKKIIVSIVFGLLYLLFESFNYNTIEGCATVIDGDTIRINNEKIRFLGVDAPELKQKCYFADEHRTILCGVEAKEYLSNLIDAKIVRCKWKERDRYNRILATCSVDKKDINEEMVLAGHALAYRKYSTSYINQENIAKKEKRGIWRYKFEVPYEYRSKQRAI